MRWSGGDLYVTLHCVFLAHNWKQAPFTYATHSRSEFRGMRSLNAMRGEWWWASGNCVMWLGAMGCTHACAKSAFLVRESVMSQGFSPALCNCDLHSLTYQRGRGVVRCSRSYLFISCALARHALPRSGGVVWCWCWCSFGESIFKLKFTLLPRRVRWFFLGVLYQY